METGSAANSPPPNDPVIEAYKPGIDRTLIRHNLTLTIEQRIDALQSLMRSIAQMQEMGRRARDRDQQREPR
jgi:hypothetical protein